VKLKSEHEQVACGFRYQNSKFAEAPALATLPRLFDLKFNGRVARKATTCNAEPSPTLGLLFARLLASMLANFAAEVLR